MHVIRYTILLPLFFCCAIPYGRAQQGFGAPAYWQHFGVSPKGDAILGTPLPPGRTSFRFSTTHCPPPGGYTIIKRVPASGCFNDEWIPLNHDQNSTYMLSHAEGNLMLINNEVADSSRILYKDTLTTPLCPGIDYFFSAAIINIDRPVTCPGNLHFPRLAFMLKTASERILATDTLRDGIPFANPVMGYKFSEFGVWLTMPALNEPLVLQIDLLTTFYDCSEDFAIDDIRLRPKGATAKIQFPEDPTHTVASACYRENPTITMYGTVDPYYAQPAYQWQVSTDSGAVWSDVPGATSLVFTQTYSVPDTFYYRLSAAEQSMIGNPACRVVSNKLQVEIQGPPSEYHISSNAPVCSGKPLLFKADGGSRYDWYGPNGFTDNIPYPSIFNSQLADSGWYHVWVYTWGGCRVLDSIKVTIIGTDVHAGTDTAICMGNSLTLHASEGVKYEWTGDNMIGNRYSQNPVIKPSRTSTYTVKVTDRYGCSDTSSVQIRLRNKIPLKAIMDFPPFLCRSIDSLHFKSNSTGIISSWNWSFGNNQISSHEAPPVQHYNIPDGRTSYNAQLIVTDTAGCSDTARQVILVEDNCYIAVPSAFTPNNDGLNDYLYPVNAYKVSNLHFRVFNRQGLLVFESRERDKKWNGRVKGELQDSGTYIWILTYTDESGKYVNLKGTSVLLR